MTLKQQFIKTLELILKSYPDYQILMDVEAKFCIQPGLIMDSIDDDYFCSDCDMECNGCISQKVDLCIENIVEDFRAYIVFNHRPVKELNDCIYSIKNTKQMYEVLNIIKDDAEKYTYYKSAYFDKIKILKEYATKFYKQLQGKYMFAVCTDILPIVFHEGLKDDSQYTAETKTLGNCCAYKNQIQINIYGCGDEIMVDDIKQTIRHEIIHYCLQVCGLKDSDDSAVFHVLCEKYNANAYKEMPPKEQKLYEKHKQIVNFIEGMIPQLEKMQDDQRWDRLIYIVKELDKSKDIALLGIGDKCKKGKYKSLFDNNYKVVCDLIEIMNQKNVSEKI